MTENNTLSDAPINLVDALLAESNDDGVETFTLTVGKGHALKGQLVRDADGLNKMFRRARVFIKKTKANTPPSWHPYLPISEDVAQGMAFMEAMLVEPKLSHLDMLRLAKGAGGYFLTISADLKAKALGLQVDMDVEGIDDEGNA